MRIFPALLATGALLLSACGEKAVTPAFFPDANPQHLSEWGAIGVRGGVLALGEGVTPYSLNTPLFTDYAHKLRTVWSVGGPAAPQGTDVFDFPVGTVITKTFYYPMDGGRALRTEDLQPVNADSPLDLASHRLVETRLLVRRVDGWHPVSYVWNEEQTDAVLKRTGAVIPMTLATDAGARDFAYVVPNENQCTACHAPNATTKTISPLGPTPGQLSGSYAYATGAMAQLDHWQAAGLIGADHGDDQGQVAWDDALASLDSRARSYLDANCAHCHNPQGPADTSGLDLTIGAAGPALGFCKPPIAAGSGTGGRRFGIVPGAPESSILTYRMASTDPGAMMPELGRSLAHEEGVALIDAWIEAMDEGC